MHEMSQQTLEQSLQIKMDCESGENCGNTATTEFLGLHICSECLKKYVSDNVNASL